MRFRNKRIVCVVLMVLSVLLLMPSCGRRYHRSSGGRDERITETYNNGRHRERHSRGGGCSRSRDRGKVALGGCTRWRGQSQKSEQAQRQTVPENRRKPVVKHDTIYMVVPIQPENKKEFGDENTEIVFPTTKQLKPLVHEKELPTPPKIEFTRPQNIYTREQYINYHEITGEMKDLIVACDYDNSTVRNNAVALVSISPGPFNFGQVCDIFDFCYMNWSYVNDPITRDYNAKASETLRNGLNGDCDDFAILMCSMILAVGGEARINFAYKGNKGHAFAEVNMGITGRGEVKDYLLARYGDVGLNYKEEDGNWWLNLDWSGRYPGAKYWDYENGTCFNIIRNIYKELE